MKIQDVILFLALFGVFFAALNISFSPQRNVLKLCDPRSITRLQIKNENQSVVAELGKDTASWFLFTGASKDKADDRTMDLLTKAVCVFPYVEKINAAEIISDKEWQALGLKDATQQITINNGEQTLFFGNTTPSGTEFYFMTSVTPEVIFTVPNKLLRELAPNFMDLRDHVIFSDLNQNDELSLTFSDITIVLKNDGKGWYDANQILSQTQASNLIKIVGAFSYTNYHDDVTTEKINSYGLDYPDVTLELKSNKDAKKQHFDMILLGKHCHLLTQLYDKTYILILNGKTSMAFFNELHAILEKRISLGIPSQQSLASL